MSVRRLRDARRHAGCVGAGAQVSMRRWCTGRGCVRRFSGIGRQRMRDDARRVRATRMRACSMKRRTACVALCVRSWFPRPWSWTTGLFSVSSGRRSIFSCGVRYIGHAGQSPRAHRHSRL